MERSWVKVGTLLLSIWLLLLIDIGSSYRTVELSKQQIEELSNGLDELRNSFFYQAPYRVKMVDDQALDLQLIYALRLQIEADYQKHWLIPDLNQLLFSTDRFIELARAYLDNGLAVNSLVRELNDMRVRYRSSPELASQYFQLSANVFEAMYLTEKDNAEVFRQVDKVYQYSTQLPTPERKELQQVLVSVSQVLSSYAQGSYLVDKLIAHDVAIQVALLEAKYRQTLNQHIIAGILLTVITMLGYLWLLHSAQTRVAMPSAQAESAVPQTDQSTTPKVEISDTRVESSPQIDFDSMFSSLSGDVDSICMLLEVFITDHANDVSEINRLLKESPIDAERKAHSLKGVGGNLGAHQLREVAAKVELAIQQDISQVSVLLQQLQVYLDTAVNEAEAFLKQHNAS